MSEPSERYVATLERLFSLARFGEKLDLSTPRALEATLEHPLGAYRSILIGGTNGKGSTAAMTEALLRRGGLKTGLFTSPHLTRFAERIRVDGELVSEEAVIRWTPKIFEAAASAGLQPSFFEAVWAMAACIFAEAEVDVVIWEVGLGGRLDATNVCDPVASAVVSVGLDHTHVLGSSVEAIAQEKAPIFRRGRPAFTGASGRALAALRQAWPEGLTVIDPEQAEGLPPLALPGPHQRINAAIAVALTEALGVSPDLSALSSVSWPGRGERMGQLILDCAHNPPAAEALAAWLDEAGLGPMPLIFGAMADKDVAGVIAPLRRHVSALRLVTPAYPRRMAAADLAQVPEVAALDPHVGADDSVGAALDQLQAATAGSILVTGSCFLVGEARAHLLRVPFPEGGILTTAR